MGALTLLLATRADYGGYTLTFQLSEDGLAEALRNIIAYRQNGSQAPTSPPLSVVAPHEAASEGSENPHRPIKGWFRPTRVNSIDEMGLSSGLLQDLVLKALYQRGQITPAELVPWLKIPFYGVLEGILRELSNQELCFVAAGQNMNAMTYTYAITSQGQERAREISERNAYVGPAPVSLAHYWSSVGAPSLDAVAVHEDELRQAFGTMVVDDSLFDQLGPAANSARAMFLYGSPGNGKTAIAETLVRLLGGDVYVPYAIEANGEIIRVFDPVHHTVANPAYPESIDDPRWVFTKRPIVTVGGELTLQTLDLIYNDQSRYYEAPFQLKSNNGAFFIDDFGRQQVSPQDLLNRWIVPLEKRVDYLTLRTGQKLEVPFETLIIFSTNLDPRDLVDEAFLRRIRYKIEVKSPTAEQYRTIFKSVCTAKGLRYDEALADYLLLEKYPALGIEPRAVHPRDLIEQILDYCNYRQTEPVLTKEAFEIACLNYFVAL